MIDLKIEPYQPSNTKFGYQVRSGSEVIALVQSPDIGELVVYAIKRAQHIAELKKSGVSDLDIVIDVIQSMKTGKIK